MGANAVDTAFEDLKRWARTSEFPDSIRWGDVEAKIMAHSPPPRDQLDPRLKRNDRMRSLIGYLIALPEIVAVFGSSVIGLVTVVAYARYDWSVASDWFFLIHLVFISAIVVPVMVALKCWTTKRRGRWELPVTGGTSVASLTSSLLLATTPRGAEWSWIMLYAIVATVLGVAAFVLLLLVADPGIRRPWRERWRAVAPEEKWYRGMRAGVLAELAKRDLVNRHDVPDMVEMPLRSWHELDDRPPPA